MTDFRFTALAQSLPLASPFVGPETQERARGEQFKARLGANESTFGPSPLAIKAMAEAGHWMYGDPESHDLRHALAKHHGYAPENIMVGEGIDGLLGYIVRLFVEQGDAVVTSDGAYPTFNYHVGGYGGILHKVDYVDNYEDPKTLLQKADQVDAKLVYLANPDNPMGTWRKGTDIIKALDDLPKGCLMVLDEAYVETAPEGTEAKVDPNDPRVIRMRTFSKAYGMAGARVGYAIGNPELIANFNKVRNHFGMNRAAQAGALAALADQDYLNATLDKVKAARDRIAQIAHSNGLEPVPSATNFVAIDCMQDGAFAKKVLAALIDQGLFVRMPFAASQSKYIRISCGSEQDLDLFEATLPKALAVAAQT
jgi:histidinol-phosphate aminotransferase